jgi:hypothetical protein
LELRVLPFLSLLLEDKLQSPLFHRGAKLIDRRALTIRATSWNGFFTPVNVISGGARVYLADDTTLTLHVGEDFMFCMECYDVRFSRETNAPDISATLVIEKTFPALRL